MNKYHNKKAISEDGEEFSSMKELKYYNMFKKEESEGLISNLQKQVKFELQPKFIINDKTIRAINYIADFTFYDKDGKYHVIDIKASKKFQAPEYKIKKKLFAYKYGFEIEEKY